MTSVSKPLVAVIGAGAMGRGIVQLFAQAGHQVKFFDVSADALAAAHSFISEMIQGKAKKNKISQEEADRIIARLTPCSELSDLADCEIIMEAIIEDVGIKQGLFVELENVVSPSAILASNTSSLLVAEIGAKCKNPERVAGLHFFNPVPVMKVVEIISAVRTAATTVAILQNVIAGTGHRAVVTQDQPGFLVNHAGRGLYTEGLRILEEQAASHEQVDRLMREAAGFRMGPFELFDLTGLDVSGKVLESIYEQFQHEPRFRPSSLIPPRIAAGLYGRKTGAGWYRYQDGKRVDSKTPATPALSASCTVWIDPEAEQYSELTALVNSSSAQKVEKPGDASLQIVQPWGLDCSQACADRGLNSARCVAVDPLPAFGQHRTLMITPMTSATARDDAAAILCADNTPVTVINDSPGFVTQRILATIVNIGCNIAQRGIATVADIDDAVKIGLGYPLGPLSLGDSLGGDKIMRILEGMQQVTGDPRYRPSLWLRRRVQLGQRLTTEEAATA